MTVWLWRGCWHSGKMPWRLSGIPVGVMVTGMGETHTHKIKYCLSLAVCLNTYLHKIDPQNDPLLLCPLCNIQIQDTNHLFTCTSLPTHLTPVDLWNDPGAVARLLTLWDNAVGAAGGVS